MLQPLKPADRKMLLSLLTQLGRSQQRSLARAAARRGRARASRQGGLMAVRGAKSVLIARRPALAAFRPRWRSPRRALRSSCSRRPPRSARSAPGSSSAPTPSMPSTRSASAKAARGMAVYIDQLRFDGRARRRARSAASDLGENFRARFGNPYAVIHRGDLHGVLLRACEEHPLVELRTSAEVVDYDQDGGSVVGAACERRDGRRGAADRRRRAVVERPQAGYRRRPAARFGPHDLPLR